MSSYLPAACSLIGESTDNIVKAEERDGSYIVLIDLGIQGIKKYSFPLSVLDAVELEPVPTPQKKTTQSRSTKKAGTK